MTRVVIDTNFTGRGHFNQASLKGLAARLAGTGAKIVIPEVVIWEWAEHARASFEALEAEHNAFRVDQALVEIPPLPLPPSADDLCEKIFRTLPSDFAVWKPTEDDHREAMRAQVLQTGAGEKKKGVKTGAADHLVYLCIRDQIEDPGRSETVVAATNDKGLRGLIREEFDEDVICVGSEHQLLAALIEFEPAEERLVQVVKDEILRQIEEATDLGHALKQFSMGYVTAEEAEEPSAWEEFRFSLERTRDVEVLELQVDKDLKHGHRVGSAFIRISGVLRGQLYMFEQIAEDDFERVLAEEWTTDALVDVPLSIIFDQAWRISSMEPAGRAYIT